jgi:hypothetical protein
MFIEWQILVASVDSTHNDKSNVNEKHNNNQDLEFSREITDDLELFLGSRLLRMAVVVVVVEFRYSKLV